MRPPRHFALVLARIAHLAVGARPETLCGRDLSKHPRRPGLTVDEAVAWIHDNIGPDAFPAIEALDRAMIEARTMIERECPLAGVRPVMPATKEE